MATYSPLHLKIWQDKKFLAYTPHQKLIFIFLTGNAYAQLSGIYEITPEIISSHNGIEINEVIKILNSYSKETVEYDFKTGIVFVKNYFSYHLSLGGNIKAVIGSLISNLRLYKHEEFWTEFDMRYKRKLEEINSQIKILDEKWNTKNKKKDPKKSSVFAVNI
jgi:hypothetical protein